MSSLINLPLNSSCPGGQELASFPELLTMERGDPQRKHKKIQNIMFW